MKRTFVFECDECGNKETVDNPIVVTKECSNCGGRMTMSVFPCKE